MITSGAVSVPPSTPSPACHRADTPRNSTMPKPWRCHPRCSLPTLCDGELFLHGLREAPSAYLTSSDAMPLRCALAAAFGSTALTRCGDPGEAL
jgi:hypothetical protein